MAGSFILTCKAVKARRVIYVYIVYSHTININLHFYRIYKTNHMPLLPPLARAKCKKFKLQKKRTVLNGVGRLVISGRDGKGLFSMIASDGEVSISRSRPAARAGMASAALAAAAAASRSQVSLSSSHCGLRAAYGLRVMKLKGASSMRRVHNDTTHRVPSKSAASREGGCL